MNKRSYGFAQIREFIFFCALILVLSPAVIRADTLDLSYLSRFGDRDSFFEVAALDLLFMAVNYLLNFLFIGYPAMRLGKISFSVMALDILFLTLVGQFADRVGANVANLVVGPEMASLVHYYQPDWITVGYYFVLNFLFSGIAIGTLVLFFGSRRWHLSMGAKWGIAFLAAIFTNPAYALVVDIWYNNFLIRSTMDRL